MNEYLINGGSVNYVAEANPGPVFPSINNNEIVKFSYVIAHMNVSPYRLRNINAIVKHIRACFKDIVEIIVVEQGFKKSDIPNVDKHLLLPEVGLFKKAKIMNIGALNASYDSIVFADNDIVLSKISIIESLNGLALYDVVNPYGGVIDLDEQQSNNLLDNGIVPQVDMTKTRGAVVFAGGVFVVRKLAFYKIGGFDESFIGWGGEDDALTVKFARLCRGVELTRHRCFHLYHDRINHGRPYHENYNNNVNLVTRIRNMNQNELVEYCKSIRGEFEKASEVAL